MSIKADEDDEDVLGEYASLMRYPAMLGGTLMGQLAGIAVQVPLGVRSLWISLVFSVIAEAVAAWLFGAKDEHRLQASQCVRISVTYSITLLVVSLPILVWLLASHGASVPGGLGLSTLTPGLLATGVAMLAVATIARAAVMKALVARSGGRSSAAQTRRGP